MARHSYCQPLPVENLIDVLDVRSGVREIMFLSKLRSGVTDYGGAKDVERAPLRGLH